MFIFIYFILEKWYLSIYIYIHIVFRAPNEQSKKQKQGNGADSVHVVMYSTEMWMGCIQKYPENSNGSLEKEYLKMAIYSGFSH